MGYLPQALDNPLAARCEALNTNGLTASPFTGATSTTVLEFVGPATITGPQGNVAIPRWIDANDDANTATAVQLLKPGVYDIELYVQQVASVDVTYGISQDVDAAGLTGVPSFAIAGFLAVQRRVTIAGQTQVATLVTASAIVSPEQSIAGSFIRFHAALTAGGAPANTMTAAAAWYRVRRVNDANV